MEKFSVPAVTLKESFRLSRAAQGHGNTPLTPHTTLLNSGFTCLENMRYENQDCMFFKWRRLIVNPCGSTGAAGYVRETRTSRCEVLSNHWSNRCSSRGVNLSVVEKWSRTNKCRCEKMKVMRDKEWKTHIKKLETKRGSERTQQASSLNP